MIYNLKYFNEKGDVIEFSEKTGFLVTDFPHLTGQYIELELAQGVNQIGATQTGAYVQPKEFTITGTLMGLAKENRKKMIDTILPLVKGFLIVNDQWFVYGTPTQTPIIESYALNPNFQFVFKAAYPYWVSTQEKAKQISGLEPLFKFPWNLGNLYSFGRRIESRFANVECQGNVPTDFRVIFKAQGKVSNPMISKVGTELFIKLEMAMELGDEIHIDTTLGKIKAYSIKNGIETNVIGLITLDSTFFKLEMGDNIITYQADSGVDFLDCVVYHSDVRTGVGI